MISSEAEARAWMEWRVKMIRQYGPNEKNWPQPEPFTLEKWADSVVEGFLEASYKQLTAEK